jgi:aryl-alcohol dehydrogenase-like predicted oxidoreductase
VHIGIRWGTVGSVRLDIIGSWRLTGMASMKNTLALGTAQLGQPYGIANRAGQPDETVAYAILEQAARLGVRCFDTAQVYGHSEEIIGRYARRDPGTAALGLRIVTKLSVPPTAGTAELEASLQGSWERLGGAPIWGMLLHRETMLDQWDGRLGDTLRQWRDRGRIVHLGVSVHTQEGMSRAIETPDVQIIQAPQTFPIGACTGQVCSLAPKRRKSICSSEVSSCRA